MRLSDLLVPECILLGVPPVSKAELIRLMVEPLVRLGAVENQAQVVRALMEREKVQSTGVGGGVALPHAHSPAVRSFAVSFARPVEPIDFDALDGKPVRIVFLAVGPEDRSGLMRVLARISRLLYAGGLQKGLLRAKDAQQVLKLVRDEEDKIRG